MVNRPIGAKAISTLSLARSIETKKPIIEKNIIKKNRLGYFLIQECLLWLNASILVKTNIKRCMLYSNKVAKKIINK
jgi:hypothetical protein